MSLDEIINGCLEGSNLHYDALYKNYGGVLFGICLRYAKDREQAADDFQEAFIKLFQQLKTYDKSRGNFEGWMKRIFVNHSIDTYRRRAKLRTSELKEVHEEFGQEDLQQPFPDLNNDQLVSLISELPDGYRVVFNLLAVEGMAHKEVAAVLNISENTSKSQFFKARKMLREKIALQHSPIEINPYGA